MHVAQDDLGRQGVVVAHADAGTWSTTFLPAMALSSARAWCSRRGAGSGRSAGRRMAGGHGLVDQLVEAGSADVGQHLAHFGGAGADVAANELVVLFKGGKRGMQGHGNPCVRMEVAHRYPPHPVGISCCRRWGQHSCWVPPKRERRYEVRRRQRWPGRRQRRAGHRRRPCCPGSS